MGQVSGQSRTRAPRRNRISYRDSVAAGVENLRAAVARASGPVMLIATRRGRSSSDRTSLHPCQWRQNLRRLRVLEIELAGHLPTRVRLGRLGIANRRGGRHIAYGFEPVDGDGLTGCEMLSRWLQIQANFLSGTVRHDGACGPGRSAIAIHSSQFTSPKCAELRAG